MHSALPGYLYQQTEMGDEIRFGRAAAFIAEGETGKEQIESTANHGAFARLCLL